jgi:hypothetical protein
MKNTKPQAPMHHFSISQWHTLKLFLELFPIIGLQLRILHPFLRPVLTQAADVILRALEEYKLISDALLDENSSGMLSNNRLLVLSDC